MHNQSTTSTAQCREVLSVLADARLACRMSPEGPGLLAEGLDELSRLLGMARTMDACPLQDLVIPEDQPALRDMLAQAQAQGLAAGTLRLAADNGPAVPLALAMCADQEELFISVRRFAAKESTADGQEPQPGRMDCQKTVSQTLEAVFQGVNTALLIHDAGGRLLEANSMALELFGLQATALASCTMDCALLSPDNPLENLPDIWSRVLAGETRLLEWQAKRQDGEPFDAEIHLCRIPYGDSPAILVAVRDISARRLAENRLKLAAKVFESSAEGITITDPDGSIMAVNPAFSSITGYSAEEALGQNPRLLKSERHEPEFYTRLWQDLLEQGQWQGEIWNRRKNGEAYPEWLSINAITDERGRPQYYVGVFHDITAAKVSQEKLQRQAYHDALTGLPNRHLLQDRLAKALAHAARKGGMLAVLFLDIDHFKAVNDRLGHPAGDQLLQAVATRLRETLRDEDTIARLGGDEFVVMIPEIGGEENAVAAARRILAAFGRPFRIHGQELDVSTSVGIAIYPTDGQDADLLIKNADVAMYRAKDQGRGSFCLYTPELNERAARKLTMEAALRKSLDKNGIRVLFQPRLSLASGQHGQICGAEALVRWKLPDGTMLPPDEFLPLAEETGLIRPLGRLVVTEACRRARELYDAGYHGLRISVNISPRQFDDPALPGLLAKAMERYDLPRGALELEINEASLMTRLDESLRILKSLRSLGLALSVDDFGTGYSSLVYLKHFPLSGLKIDRTFVAGIPMEENDMAVATTIVAMAHTLGLRVTAVGVESPEQLAFLRALRCDEYQGFLSSPALPFEDLLMLLESGLKQIN